jgi:hypothetical protein
LGVSGFVVPSTGFSLFPSFSIFSLFSSSYCNPSNGFENGRKKKEQTEKES